MEGLVLVHFVLILIEMWPGDKESNQVAAQTSVHLATLSSAI